jgi:hypothetical protein
MATFIIFIATIVHSLLNQPAILFEKGIHMFRLTTLILSLTLMIAPCLHAAGANDKKGIDRAELQANTREMIKRAMDLDAKTSAIFWPLYDDYQNARRQLNDRSVTLIQEYVKNYNSMTDGAAMILPNEQTEIETQKNLLRSEYVKKFAQALPGRVVARYFQADNKLTIMFNASLVDQIPLVPLPYQSR